MPSEQTVIIILLTDKPVNHCRVTLMHAVQRITFPSQKVAITLNEFILNDLQGCMLPL
jgi:hypothetical protein